MHIHDSTCCSTPHPTPPHPPPPPKKPCRTHYSILSFTVRYVTNTQSSMLCCCINNRVMYSRIFDCLKHANPGPEEHQTLFPGLFKEKLLSIVQNCFETTGILKQFLLYTHVTLWYSAAFTVCFDNFYVKCSIYIKYMHVKLQ